MTRISDEAIERDRISARARYHRNKETNRKVQKAYREEQFLTRPFIDWDGEGYDAYAVDSNGVAEIQHRYMLFGSVAAGICITGIKLTTSECLAAIIEAEEENPDCYHVGFSFEYDVNMILADLPFRMLAILKECGACRWVDPVTGKVYHIEHIPHKWFRVSCDGVSATIYDTFGFFHSGYLAALKKYAVGDESKLAVIAAGKAKRGHFNYADIEEVKTYWTAENSLLPALVEHIRTAAYGGGYRVSEWHGPGALAAYLLRDRGVKKWHSKGTIPPEVRYAIRAAYAGGRFITALCGLYIGDIYTADLNSAYIRATSILPRMDRGTWKRQTANRIDRSHLARFGVYRIEYDAGPERKNGARKQGLPEPPYPLFHRSKNGVLRWPAKCIGWYWTPEAELVKDDPNARFLEAWIFDDDGTYPFEFVNTAFDRRLSLQRQNNPAEKAYKWGLAAMYGAFARRVGWDKARRKPPPSHELSWAGYITSWCRAEVHKLAIHAYEKGNGRGLVSVDTDGVTATVPFGTEALSDNVGEALGQWKLEKWTGILHWQNGIYWLRDSDGNWKDPKSRGIPKGSIPFQTALSAYEAMDFSSRPYTLPSFSIVRTQFIGYRQALRGRLKDWRKWITSEVRVSMAANGNSKAVHQFRCCYACRKWSKRYEDKPGLVAPEMHTVSQMPDLSDPGNIESYPHKLPWLEEQPSLPAGFTEPDDLILIVKDADM